MSFQTFFRRFRRIGGCSGTLDEVRRSSSACMDVPVVRVPTHRPRLTRCWSADAGQGRRRPVAGRGRRVVGRGGSRAARADRRAQRGRRSALAEAFAARGVRPQVLNALAHAQEAAIVAEAGQAGVIAIATNMAGRGTDIRLGEGVAQRGGLHVIVAEANDSARIDRQLAGRCRIARATPAVCPPWLCLEDDLATRMLPAALRRILAASTGTAPVIAPRLARHAFRIAQRRAEAVAFQRRLSVLRAGRLDEFRAAFRGPRTRGARGMTGSTRSRPRNAPGSRVGATPVRGPGATAPSPRTVWRRRWEP
jgi:preprotein translocase subunit SecA